MPAILFPFFPSSHLTHLFSSFLLQIFSHLSSLLLLHLLHYLLSFPIFFYASLLFSPVLSSLLSFFFAPLSFHCLLLASPAFLSFSPSALFPLRPSFKLLCLPFLSPRSSNSIFLYLISICSLLFCLSSSSPFSPFSFSRSSPFLFSVVSPSPSLTLSSTFPLFAPLLPLLPYFVGHPRARTNRTNTKTLISLGTATANPSPLTLPPLNKQM